MGMKVFLALTSALCLAGCATKYQSNGLTGGFSDRWLGDNVYRVSFNGNGHTSPVWAADMALIRSAELAIHNGYSNFIVIDGRSSSDTYQFSTPPSTTTGVDAYGYARTTTYGGQSFTITKPGTTNTVAMFRSKPSGFSYDAAQICSSLGPEYGAQCGHEWWHLSGIKLDSGEVQIAFADASTIRYQSSGIYAIVTETTIHYGKPGIRSLGQVVEIDCFESKTRTRSMWGLTEEGKFINDYKPTGWDAVSGNGTRAEAAKFVCAKDRETLDGVVKIPSASSPIDFSMGILSSLSKSKVRQ